MDSSKRLTALLLLQLGYVLAFDKVLEKNRLDGQETHDIDIYVEKKISYFHAKIDLKPKEKKEINFSSPRKYCQS